MIKRILQNIF